MEWPEEDDPLEKLKGDAHLTKESHSPEFVSGRFVSGLLCNELEEGHTFHDIHHTLNVVRAGRKISKKIYVKSGDEELVALAAWFHDTGFVKAYHGHEEHSVEIAEKFLSSIHYPTPRIERVTECIHATRMPQAPKDDLQKVICDADMYHLSMPEYCFMQELLRKELRKMTGKECSEAEWVRENIDFMKGHQFWTDYGQEVLEEQKQQNIRRCELLLADLTS